MRPPTARLIKTTAKHFRAWRAWRKVTMAVVARRAGSQLNVRVAINRLAKKKMVLVDDVSVLKWLPVPTPEPTPTPDPEPTPDPNPTDPPGPVAGHLSNGCAIDARGIPGSCAAYLGSAYGSNADPTPWENTMGQQLGIRRTYWGASQVDKACRDRQDRPRRAPPPVDQLQAPLRLVRHGRRQG